MEERVGTFENGGLPGGRGQAVRTDWSVDCGRNSEGLSEFGSVLAQPIGLERVQVLSLEDRSQNRLRSNLQAQAHSGNRVAGPSSHRL